MAVSTYLVTDVPQNRHFMTTAQPSASLDISQTVLEAIAHDFNESLTVVTPTASQIFQTDFDIGWNLPTFLRDQQYDASPETAMELAIMLMRHFVGWASHHVVCSL